MSIQRARQVHLDFHTSELIPDVGARFDKHQWQEALRVGRINQINVFAKCHHSWSYYPTKVGMVHPTLKRNLLGEQIEACHEIDVRCPIYYTVGWSATQAEQHPEWLVRDRSGVSVAANYDLSAQASDKRPNTSWKYLCPSGTYLEHMLAQTREICETFDVDGFWYDICFAPSPCYCQNCLDGMRKANLDPRKAEDAADYYLRKWAHFLTECNRIIHARFPQATTYYNGMTKDLAHDFTPWMTQIELEDLPTTWGGYDRFPLRSKWYANKHKSMVAMSGKFHTSWGEFGGFKHPDAIRLEAAAMLAYGAQCNFGDQLHPSGEMDMSTYRALGEAFAYVETIESYGMNASMCANLGVWYSMSTEDDQGAVNMLLESQRDFEAVAAGMDLSRFKAIILTGGQCLDLAAAAQLGDYVKSGGALLVLGESALDRGRKEVLLDVGGRYLGPANYDVDYLVVGDKLADGLVRSPFLNYVPALRAQATDGEVLARIREPYFSRTYGQYCSHMNTPPRPEDAAHVGALQKGRVIWLPHALGRNYLQLGARVHRQLFVNALKLIYGEPTLSTRMPSAGRANLLHQRAERRYVVHLLYAPPLQRGRCLIIEDLVPLHDVPVELRVPEKIKQVYLAPSGTPLTVERGDGVLRVSVPKVEGHQMVVFAY